MSFCCFERCGTGGGRLEIDTFGQRRNVRNGGHIIMKSIE